MDIAGALSSRGRKNVLSQCHDEPVCPWDLYLANPFAASNHDGFISLAYAENKLVWPHVSEYYKNVEMSQLDSLYDYAFGGTVLREGFCKLMQHFTRKQLHPRYLVGCGGAAAVLENLAFCLFDPGQTVAMLVPCYHMAKSLLTTRNDLQVTSVAKVDDLLQLIREKKVHGVLWTNPGNPCGTVYPREVVQSVVEEAVRNGVHVMADEIFAPCAFGKEMVSVLDFCTSEASRAYVHVVSGLAKLGWSGAKLGFVYTENSALVKSLRELSRMAPISTTSAALAIRMLQGSPNKIKDILRYNRRTLQDHYHAVTALLRRYRIPYVPADGGLTLLLDFRSVVGRLGEGWAGEQRLFEIFVNEARVHVASGRAFCFKDPGYFRLTFSEPLDAITIAIERLHSVLEQHGLTKVLARDSIMNRMSDLWKRTDRILGMLKDESYMDRPIKLRHPFLFYLGHLPAFLWNQLLVFSPKLSHFDEELAKLFERGIDPDVDTGTVHSNSAGVNRTEWPDLKSVRRFRDEVRKRLPELLDHVLERDPKSHMELTNGRIFELVYEHETMHQETLLYMFNCLDISSFDDSAAKNLAAVTLGDQQQAMKALDMSFAHIPASNKVTIGASLDDPEVPWGWDNEFPSQTLEVDAFSIRKTPVTNREFMDFVNAGGYKNASLWDEADWKWLESEKMEHPVHWKKQGSDWVLRTLCQEIPLAGEVLDWPVQVSSAEANAWCKWRNDGSRLPTEAEWYHAAFSESGQESGGIKYRRYPWGDQPPTKDRGNFNFERYHPTPVNKYPLGRNFWGMYDLLGNGWEWTSSTFQGFPGYQAFLTSYPGYSADFFDGKHFVLRGGSFATVEEQLRPSFRNWYQGRYPYVFSKFRPVRPIMAEVSSGNILRLEVAASEEQTLREFADHVRQGLSLEKPVLSSLYFYDDEGSRIYEDITRLDEYYLTRTEHAILKECKAKLVEALGTEFKKFNLVEFGAGDGHKTQTLLDHFSALSLDVTYFPIDISEGALQSLLKNVSAPRICPLVANNLVGCSYVISQTTSPTLALFLGSSIGNYDLPDAIEFLRNVQALLRVGDYLLIGFDLKKDLDILHAAYFDSKGVTSKFNYNLLSRINRELGGNFDLESGVWKHHASWNPNVGAMESWLIPTQDQVVKLGPQAGGISVRFNQWEGILVERSHKYTLTQIKQMAFESGFVVVETFIKNGFCECLFKKEKLRTSRSE